MPKSPVLEISASVAILNAVCQILASGHPEKLTLKAIAHKARISTSIVRRRANVPWKLLAIYDEGIRAEFRQRRILQAEELGVGNSAGDFFMR